ncbi:aflatoxin B1 aldehyde reductase member 3-like [Halichondria panicea]|uniref:aflatoxin B1 aldehyde reductase member 3-like n=1 Tax=Halichondria panicea TaxID=6063 RepID=UPI00312B8D02
MSLSSRLKVILGTGDFRRRGFLEEKECFNALNLFLSRGGRNVDTALVYAHPEGSSDETIGKYTATSPNGSQLSVGTKINQFGEYTFKKECVYEQANKCLTNLQTSCVDILYLHSPDHATPIEETLEAMQQLYTEGKFKELGVCNYASWEVANICQICKSRGWVSPTVYQGMYNAITRNVEKELLPALRYFGLRFYVYNPTACGMLTGKYRYSDFENTRGELKEGRFFIDPQFSSLYRDRYWRESVFKGVELVRGALDESYGVGKVSLVSAAYRWLNHHSQLSPEHGGVLFGIFCIRCLFFVDNLKVKVLS